MKFFLDSLFISLVILVLLLVYRFIKQKILDNRKKAPLFAYLHPIADEDFVDGELKIKYEIPEATKVQVTILDNNEQQKKELINKEHEAGNYFISYTVPLDEKEFMILFKTHNTSTIKRVSL